MKDAEEAGFSSSPRGQHQLSPDQKYQAHSPRSPGSQDHSPMSPGSPGQGHQQWDRGRDPYQHSNGYLPQDQKGWQDTARDHG